MDLRPLLVAWLVTCVAVLQPVVVNGHALTATTGAAVLLCALAFSLVVALPSDLPGAAVAVPVRRRLRGRFLQQSRPGVPGRIRARAPGYRR